MAVNFCNACGQKLEADWTHCPGCSKVIYRTATESAPRRRVYTEQAAESAPRRRVYTEQAAEQSFENEDPDFLRIWNKKCRNETILFFVCLALGLFFACGTFISDAKNGFSLQSPIASIIMTLEVLVIFTFGFFGAAKSAGSSFKQIGLASLLGFFNPIAAVTVAFPIVFKVIFGVFAGFVWGPMFIYRFIKKQPVVTRERVMKDIQKEQERMEDED